MAAGPLRCSSGPDVVVRLARERAFKRAPFKLRDKQLIKATHARRKVQRAKRLQTLGLYETWGCTESDFESADKVQKTAERMFLRGILARVMGNHETAFELFRAAATAGSAVGMVEFARYLLPGMVEDFGKDIDSGHTLLESALGLSEGCDELDFKTSELAGTNRVSMKGPGSGIDQLIGLLGSQITDVHETATLGQAERPVDHVDAIGSVNKGLLVNGSESLIARVAASQALANLAAEEAHRMRPGSKPGSADLGYILKVTGPYSNLLKENERALAKPATQCEANPIPKVTENLGRLVKVLGNSGDLEVGGAADAVLLHLEKIRELSGRMSKAPAGLKQWLVRLLQDESAHKHVLVSATGYDARKWRTAGVVVDWMGGLQGLVALVGSESAGVRDRATKAFGILATSSEIKEAIHAVRSSVDSF